MSKESNEDSQCLIKSYLNDLVINNQKKKFEKLFPDDFFSHFSLRLEL